ncbi:MAG: metallophosphoesterase [Myxococcota bacterium]|nr:metallophosphoesterase [Myxococcota bacterium]
MAEEFEVERAFCVSDLHIRHSADPIALRFRRFLKLRVKPDPRATLVIAGDCAHFWFGRRGQVPACFRPLVEELETLPSVLWVEGNHDLRLRRALGPRSSIRVVDGSLVLLHGGRRLHVEHGHRVDPADWSQRILDRFLHTPVADLASGILRERGTQAIGLWAAGASAGLDGYDGRDARWLEAALARAERLGKEGIDLAVMGHGHYLGWWDQGLVCLGDWLHFDSYFELDRSGAWAIRRFQAQESCDPPVTESPLGEIPR